MLLLLEYAGVNVEDSTSRESLKCRLTDERVHVAAIEDALGVKGRNTQHAGRSNKLQMLVYTKDKPDQSTGLTQRASQHLWRRVLTRKVTYTSSPEMVSACPAELLQHFVTISYNTQGQDVPN